MRKMLLVVAALVALSTNTAEAGGDRESRAIGRGQDNREGAQIGRPRSDHRRPTVSASEPFALVMTAIGFGVAARLRPRA
jgi:hypothetical protein